MTRGLDHRAQRRAADPSPKRQRGVASRVMGVGIVRRVGGVGAFESVPSVVVSLVLLLAGSAFAQSGGNFDLTWNTVDGGGGRSTGGTFVLTGTVGQADAGGLAGGTLTLRGGFWAPEETTCASDADCGDGDECTIDTCDPGNPEAGGDGCVHDQGQVYADICSPFAPNGPQPDLDDILCELDDFADGASVSGCPNGCTGAGGPQQGTTDIHPCLEDGGGDGQIILDDILNMLDAFAGNAPCADTCP